MGDKNYATVLSKEEVQTILANDFQSDEITLLDYHVKPFSENPMGFLGVHYQIITSFKLDGVEKTKRYFAKKIPEDIPSHNAYAKESGAFLKEIEFYERVVKDVELNLISEKSTKWSPKYLYARDYDILVVEHLCDEGFSMYPERTELDLDHVMISMRAMAAMHAGPMILEQKLMDNRVKHAPKGWSPGQPSTLEHVYNHIVFETECNGDPKSPGNRFYEAGFKSQLAIVDLLPNYTKAEKDHIKNLLSDILRRIFPFVKPSEKFRNTWVHGDLWSNNIMFRYNEKKQVEEASIIDFQLSRLVPPAQDVVMFIHLVQSRGFRKQHLAEVLNAYYDAFTKEVEAEGYQVETILPRSEFDNSCEFYYEFALLSQVMFYQMTLSPPRITSKFLASPELFDLNMLTDRTEMVVETYKTDELSRKRITEAMDELINFYKLTENIKS